MITQITVSDLASRIDQANLRIIDGSWALDGTDMNALYQREHIPGAVFFDLEAISDKRTDLPHMAPTPQDFAEAVGLMGITEADIVVIYDQFGLFSAARIWWTFKLMGHKSVFVLRGGLPAWKAQGGVVTDEVKLKEKVNYAPRFNKDLVIDINKLKALIDVNHVKIIDARPEARFLGVAAEPRPGLRSGHMPLSQSLPFSLLIDGGALRPAQELIAAFDRLNLTHDDHIVTTCGSGVTAAILSMALMECGFLSHQLYDGSWAQWGREDSGTKVINGTAVS